MAASISLKLSRGDETRVLSLPVQPIPTWQDLAASLAERFQLDEGPSAVTYLDHEGDQITVSSDVELKDMWHSFAGKSSVSVGVVAPFAHADHSNGRSAATEKLLESIRDAVAADPSVAFDIHGILAGSAIPIHGSPHGDRHGHPGGRRGGRGGGRGGRGGWHGHGHGRNGPMHPGPGQFPFFPPPPPPFGDFMHACGAPPPPPFGRHHPHGPPPPPPFCGRRHPQRHREESDSSESSDSSSSDSSDNEGKHHRHGAPRRRRHHSRGHGPSYNAGFPHPFHPFYTSAEPFSFPHFRC
ncbi:hypothetical protein RHOSPDRAFT_32724 [Rhodotorula sp. JG-1b]|nr:hypothetical protein RHOSPDRAFT_32724 [Rhodotorula sp. JG-1b]